MACECDDCGEQSVICDDLTGKTPLAAVDDFTGLTPLGECEESPTGGLILVWASAFMEWPKPVSWLHPITGQPTAYAWGDPNPAGYGGDPNPYIEAAALSICRNWFDGATEVYTFDLGVEHAISPEVQGRYPSGYYEVYSLGITSVRVNAPWYSALGMTHKTKHAPQLMAACDTLGITFLPVDLTQPCAWKDCIDKPFVVPGYPSQWRDFKSEVWENLKQIGRRQRLWYEIQSIHATDGVGFVFNYHTDAVFRNHGYTRQEAFTRIGSEIAWCVPQAGNLLGLGMLTDLIDEFPAPFAYYFHGSAMYDSDDLNYPIDPTDNLVALSHNYDIQTLRNNRPPCVALLGR